MQIFLQLHGPSTVIFLLTVEWREKTLCCQSCSEQGSTNSDPAKYHNHHFFHSSPDIS